MLREEIKLELENAKDDYDRSIIKPIFNSLEEYTEGKTDRQQTVRQAAEIIERFARRGQTERRSHM